MIADAAITTIAREGMRGFTHRAVDRLAELPEGSTSYYFRTREALMFAALARMAELDSLDIGEPSSEGSLDALAELLASVLQVWLTTGRDRTLARFELTLESTRRPELKAKMLEYGTMFRLMSESALRAAGASEPERRGRTLVAHIDGLVLHELTRVGGGESDLQAACRDVLAIALA